MRRRLDISRAGKPVRDKKTNIDRADILIIGNGIAGLTAALEARRRDPGKRIAIITDQNHPTINTPALKQFAIGKLTPEQLLAYPAGTERAERIHIIHARVEAIHARSKFVLLAGGSGFGYDSLLLATGSRPAGLPADLPGRDFDGVLTLHRLHDYLNLRRWLSQVDTAVVIGGGAHAIETVMSLLQWGISVHWLIRSHTFLPHLLDQPASDMILERMRKAGARIYTETEVVGIVGRVGVVAGVFTNQHQMIPCQLVLACTGTRPFTALAEHCDLPLKQQHGILVDDQLHTNVPAIYAAGDVAALRNPQTGTYAPRAQWYAAVLQGRRAAASMTHSESNNDAAPFGVPWHATQLGDLSMLTVGSPLSWTEGTTTLTDSSRGSYRRLSIVDDRLVGYLSLGPTQPDSLAIKRLIDERLSLEDIKKALLKGEFDARRYFSQRQSHIAQGMVITGKLSMQNEQAQTRLDQDLPLREEIIPGTDPASLMRVLPTTGPLPAASQTQLTLDHLRGEEEKAPCSANLPVPPTEIVESTLDALPVPVSQHVSRSLWSYSEKLPAVRKSGGLPTRGKSVRSQFLGPGGLTPGREGM